MESRRSTDTYIAALALLGISVHLTARFGFHSSKPVYDAPLIAVLIIGGVLPLWTLLRRMFRAEFGSDLLAGISIVTSVVLGEYLAGSIVLLMLSGGAALENYAMRRASSVLSALAKRMPNFAHRRINSKVADIPIEEIRIGDHLTVFPHEICPADGTVTEGRGRMDESYLTGEPFEIAKVPGAQVLSGSVNGDTALTILVTKSATDSRYAKIMHVMREAEENRPRMKRIADRLGAWYTLFGLTVAFAAWIAAGDRLRFLAVLVIATPCPLLLAVPVAILGAISIAASRGIIIRNPSMLEIVDSCRTVIFDKTGTLTYGKPSLTEIICGPGFTRERSLQLAASLEQFSKHPLARGIRAAARGAGIDPLEVTEVSERPGEGLRGIVKGSLVQITGRRAVANLPLPPIEEGLECILLVDGQYAATFRFRDMPRQESKSFIRHLAPRHHVNKVMLVSGDRESEVRYLAGEVGIGEILAGKSPEEKVAIVRAEAAKSPTLFLGDGINDAPAMQAATVGVAFGHSDITSEAADAVVLETSLAKVDELIHIGRRMRVIALQSSVGGIALSIAGMGFAAAGYLPPVAGAITQEVIDILSIVNALRVALPVRELRDPDF